MSTRDEWLAKSTNRCERYQTTEGTIEWYADKDNPPLRSKPVIYYIEVLEIARQKRAFSSFIDALKADAQVETITFCGVSNNLMEYILYNRDFYNHGGDFTWYRDIPQGRNLGLHKPPGLCKPENALEEPLETITEGIKAGRRIVP